MYVEHSAGEIDFGVYISLPVKKRGSKAQRQRPNISKVMGFSSKNNLRLPVFSIQALEPKLTKKSCHMLVGSVLAY